MIPILYKEGTNNFASFNLYLLHTAVWQLSIYNSFQIFPTFQFLSREKKKSFSSLSDIERVSQIFQVETFWPIELHTRGDRHQHDGASSVNLQLQKNYSFHKDDSCFVEEAGVLGWHSQLCYIIQLPFYIFLTSDSFLYLGICLYNELSRIYHLWRTRERGVSGNTCCWIFMSYCEFISLALIKW